VGQVSGALHFAALSLQILLAGPAGRVSAHHDEVATGAYELLRKPASG
jgi:hypothetical protein